MNNQKQDNNIKNNKAESEQKQNQNFNYRETNDNNATTSSKHFAISKSYSNSKTGSNCNVAAIRQQLAISQQLAAAAPMRQSRPLRPNLRRQMVVQTSDGTGVQPISVIVPPKRPAHLPARYDTLAMRHPSQQTAADIDLAAISNSGNKPNRYSWAQMQQWQANQAQAQAAAAAAAQLHHGFHHHFSSPFSSAASRVLVVNPMQIVNLSEHTKSRLIKFIEAIKRFSEQWFSHVLLLMFLAVYACLGAYVFISFEAPSEQWEKQLIIDTRFRIVNESYDIAKEKSRDEFIDIFRNKFEDYERLLNKACASGMTSSSLENQWTFWGALFYSMTVFTTIGYGHLTPITFAGRVATMIYAIFGIPILLMVLADLGKLLTRIIKYSFKKFRYLYNKLLRRKTSLKTRKLISENTNQYIGVAKNAFERGFSNYIQPQYNKIPQAFRSNFPKNNKSMKRESDTIDPQQQQQTELSSGTTIDNIHHKRNSQDDDLITTTKQSDCENQTTDVIMTPVKQTKPVSPQPSNDKKSPFDSQHFHHTHNQNQNHNNNLNHHHHHHNTSRAQSPGRGQSKRKTSGSNSTGASSSSKKNSSSQVNKSSISRSSSSSGLLQSNSKAAKSSERRKSSQEKQQEISGKQQIDSQLDETKEAKFILDDINNNNNNKDDHADLQIDKAPLEDVLVDGREHEGGVEEEYEEDVDDDFDIPVSFALFLLVTYMMFGAVVFSIWEGWNFFDSLYFVFISMSTIGFGDLVPQHPKRMIGTFIYLLFGLALTSMCINVVQEKIHATFLRAKMQIGEKMGLDLEQIMADDYYDGSVGMGDVEDENEDANSVAISQANSLSAHHGPDNEIIDPSETHHGQVVVPNKTLSIDHGPTSEGIKHSKSKESFKASKKRPVTGLPGHNNSSLRRKSSKRVTRQLTPSSVHHDQAASNQQQQQQQQNQPNLRVQSPSAPTTPTSTPNTPTSTLVNPSSLKPEIEVLKKSENHLSVADNQSPSANHPINGRKSVCEPLKSFREDNFTNNNTRRPKLVATRSQPTVVKSLSSEGGQKGETTANGRGLNHKLVNSSSSSMNAKQNHYYNGPKSADSSRRSSVSQELNQLDDLIFALSKSPAAEKFGPLLGIPASARTSRSNSPSTLNARRGTSMTTRPTQSSLPSPTVKKKISLIVTRSPTPSESQAALDELESLRFSAV